MARRKKKLDESTKDSSVVLFVALMLILLSFFIMMNSIAVIDSEKSRVAFNSLLGEFGGLAGQRGPAGGPSIKTTLGEHPYVDLDQLKKEFDKAFQNSDLEGKFEVDLRGKDLVLTLPAQAILLSDPRHIPEKSRSLLQTIAQLLIKTALPVRIEGHSAGDLPDGERPVDMQLWTESVQRAQTVCSYLIEWGIPENQLSVAGYGATRPLFSNELEEGRTSNRRVEIVVVDGASDPAIRFHPVDVEIGRWTFKRIDYRGERKYERIN